MLKKYIFAFLFSALCAGSALAQQQFVGTVSRTLDGRTVEVQTSPNRSLRVRLQAIEVPEADQPLSGVVREHLGKLAEGRTAHVEVRQIIDNLPVGRVVVDGVDLTQQMLRDGAAWYAVAERGNYAPQDAAFYREAEALAKAEKRGVWGVAGLKPAWEFRAEREARRAAERRGGERAVSAETPARTVRSVLPPRTGGLSPANDKVRLWADVGGAIETSGASGGGNAGRVKDLYEGLEFLPSQRTGGSVLVTPTLFVSLSGAGNLKRLGIGFGQFYPERTVVVGDDRFLVGIVALSENRDFVRSSRLVIRTARGRVIDLGRHDARISESGYGFTAEVLFYRVTRAELAAVAAGKSAAIRVGGYDGRISPDSLAALKRLLAATQ